MLLRALRPQQNETIYFVVMSEKTYKCTNECLTLHLKPCSSLNSRSVQLFEKLRVHKK